MKKTTADYRAKFRYDVIPDEEVEVRTATIRTIIGAAEDRVAFMKLSANENLN